MTPIFGAIIADQYLGRKATITHASRIYAVGLFILFGSSLSVFESSSVPILALLAAMLLIGIGAGGIRPNVNSLIAEQYQPAEQRVHKLDTGENVYVDYDMTIQRSVQSLLHVCADLEITSKQDIYDFHHANKRGLPLLYPNNHN